MRVDITVAALDAADERRVRLAAPLLAAYDMRTHVRDWDGTRCDLVIVRSEDAYGERVIELARRRNTPILDLSPPSSGPAGGGASGRYSTAALAARMRVLFAPATDGAVASADVHVKTELVLCRLASREWRGKPARIESGSTVVWLRPRTGRAWARSSSDLVVLAESCASPGWRLDATPARRPADVVVSCSMETLMLRAAVHARKRLPPFPDGRYRMVVWPDLGSAPELTDALRLTRLLVQTPRTLAEIRSSTANLGMDPDNVNACLWGLAAADLLLETDDAQVSTHIPAVSRRRMRQGLWKNLARRFGLVPRSPSR